MATYDIVFDDSFSSDYKSYDFEHSFKNCPVPTLICEGKYDSLWSAKKLIIMKENFPNAQFIAFEKSSHNIYSDEPELFLKTIAGWADSLKTADDEKIVTWKNNTNEVLGEQINLINNGKLLTFSSCKIY
jgi:proline iminopeptidase